MGVIYKLKDEVVHFIISRRQSNPLFSCRQLAEEASQRFGLHLSKSSVHDVLKASGIMTPRGRKPRDGFAIPHEKKKQIQNMLSQVKLPPGPMAAREAAPSSVINSSDPVISPSSPVILSEAKDLNQINSIKDSSPSGLRMTDSKEDSVVPMSSVPDSIEISPEYEGAGKIFLKAALWDLGIFSPHIKEVDWGYYLTYCKGIKVDLENNQSFFIDLPLPVERCVREAVDGLVNNVKPLIVDKVSDETLFKSCMDAQTGHKITKISIVEQNDHVLFEINSIVEIKRTYYFKNREFMESKERNALERAKLMFFSPQSPLGIAPTHPDAIAPPNPDVIASEAKQSFNIDNIINLKGFDSTSKSENTVTLLVGKDYENKEMILQAAEKLNGMYVRDDQDRLVSVKIQ